MIYLYNKTCVLLMRVESSRYALLSGIIISLATNIFTSLCCDTIPLSEQYHKYISVVLFIISGALCLLFEGGIKKYQTELIKIRDSTIAEIKNKSKQSGGNYLDEIKNICSLSWQDQQFLTIISNDKKKLFYEFFIMCMTISGGVFFVLI